MNVVEKGAVIWSARAVRDAEGKWHVTIGQEQEERASHDAALAESIENASVDIVDQPPLKAQTVEDRLSSIEERLARIEQRDSGYSFRINEKGEITAVLKNGEELRQTR